MVSFNFVNPEKPDDGEIKITSNMKMKFQKVIETR
jgi:hypothetical protein